MKDVTPHCAQDEIEHWPKVQLDILREYAAPYSEVLSKRPGLHHVYIEAFHGSRARTAKPARDLVPGNPLNALAIQPPFKEFFLIDLDGKASEKLRHLVADRSDVHVLEGELSRILLDDVFPKVQEKDQRRGLCILDPVGLDLEWAVLETVGKMQSIEVFFHFPLQLIDTCVLERDRAGLPPERMRQIDRIWGDDSWRAIALPAAKKVRSDEPLRVADEAIVESFRKRLINQTGFTFVPKPLPLCNDRGEIVDYLFFASHNVLGGQLIAHLFEKHAYRTEKA